MLLNSKIIPLDIDINTKLVIDFAIIKISISIGDVRIISNPLFSNSLLIDLLIPSIIEKLREIQKIIEKISETNARVLITGQNGTGKELVAHAIHKQSKRNKIDKI